MLIQTYTDVTCHWIFLSLSYTEQWQEQLYPAHLAPSSLPGQPTGCYWTCQACRKGQGAGVGVTQQQWFWRNPLPLSLEAKFSVTAVSVLLQCKHLMIASARRVDFILSQRGQRWWIFASKPPKSLWVISLVPILHQYTIAYQSREWLKSFQT